MKIELGRPSFDISLSAYRLNVVVHSGRNLNFDFLKGSILSQPLAFDCHHLVSSTCLRRQILDAGLSEDQFYLILSQNSPRYTWCSAGTDLLESVFTMFRKSKQ